MAQQVSTYPPDFAASSRTERQSVETRLEPAPVWPVLRILLGSVFLWSFLDKTFALGFATGRSREGEVDWFGPAAWINGGSPTKGFLTNGTEGPLADIYQSMAGNVVVDWLFMLGLLGIGSALVLGVALRPAAVAGVLLLLLIRIAIWTPENNPVIDDHIIYMILLICLPIAQAGNRWGLGRAWQALPVVRRHPFLA